jgi:hypothetical protein
MQLRALLITVIMAITADQACDSRTERRNRNAHRTCIRPL